jgi:lysyl-tRNA synthetase, class II
MHPARRPPVRPPRAPRPVGRPSRPGRPRLPGRWTPRAAAELVLLAGAINLLSAVLPAERGRLQALSAFVPGAVASTATAATAAAGIGLMLLAGGLRRRRRSALLATVALLLGSAVLHLVKSLDVEEALIEAFLGGLLLGRSEHFTARSAPGERQPVVRSALAAVGITTAYGLAGLLVNQRSVSGRLEPGSAIGAVARMAVGLEPGFALHGRFSRFFPASVWAVFVVGSVIVLLRALAPHSLRPAADPALPGLVAATDDSLAYFATRDDRASAAGGGALVSYGSFGAVAVAAGDPLGPPACWPEAIDAFLETAAAQGRVAAVIGCGAEAARSYELAGLRTVYIGDEAVLDLDAFSLDGRAVRIARQSWNRALRWGYSCQVWRSGELDDRTAMALHALSRRWRGEAAERGFSMALGRLFDRRDPETLVVVAGDPDGRPRGFLHLVPWAQDGASLDVMRRDRDAPAVLTDFLVVEAARRLPALGVRRLSLNFSFLRAVLAAGSGPGAPLGLRLERWALQRLSRAFQIETLYRFNKKFGPAWRPRYAAVEAIEDLPRVALAALRLEGLVAPPRLGTVTARRLVRPAPAPSAEASQARWSARR